METIIARELNGKESTYDASVKKLFSNKEILAWIMKTCLAEYQGYEVKEIADKYIEGEPDTACIDVNPGAEQIHGMKTEDKSRNEGTVTYDVPFYATLPNSEDRIGLIINVEAQNDYNPGYPLVKRGIYYCSRMLSAQYGTEFTGGHYEKLKKVYSIWICADAPEYRANTITQYEMRETYLQGEAIEKPECYDLLSVVMVCFNDRNKTESEGLVRMLKVLVSPTIEADEKKRILNTDYGITMSKDLESEVSLMCNLSKGVLEQGELKRAKKIAEKMLKAHKSVKEITEFTELSYDQIKELADSLNIELVIE